MPILGRAPAGRNGPSVRSAPARALPAVTRAGREQPLPNPSGGGAEVRALVAWPAPPGDSLPPTGGTLSRSAAAAAAVAEA